MPDAVAAMADRVVSLSDGELQAMNHDIEPASKISIDRTVAQASASDYDALIMPGGTVNADRLRMDDDVRRFVLEIFQAGKPVGAICHGPWLLVEADVAAGTHGVGDAQSVEAERAEEQQAGAAVVGLHDRPQRGADAAP